MLSGFSKDTIVTANARLSRQLRREHDARRRSQGDRVWPSPDILPRDAWLARCWADCVYQDLLDAPVLLDTNQEQTLWEQAITRSSADSVLLSLHETAAATVRAWKLLHEWETPCDPQIFEGIPDAEAFREWMSGVENKLRDNGWITASQLPRALAEHIGAGKFKIDGPIFHAGFDELTPADRRLFDLAGATVLPVAALTGVPQCYRAAFHDTEDELTHAAAWVRQKLEASPDARIGVVVRGLASLPQMVGRIFDDVLHPGLDFGRPDRRRAFHISAGISAADAPIIATALTVLGLVPAAGLPLDEAGTLLRSPFLRFDGVAGAMIDLDLRRQRAEKVSLNMPSVRNQFPQLAQAGDALPPRQRPSQWSTTFSRLLTLAGWPGSRTLSSIEYQTLEHWETLLSDFARLDLVLPRTTFDEALARLRRIAAASRFAPSDEDAPVQIMDILEASGSRFDALWVAGLHAGIWPQPSRPNPFLPLMLQRSVGMPHSSAERELAYARHVTARLMASAQQVVFSHPSSSQQETLRASPLIEHLPVTADLPEAAETTLRRIFASAVPLDVLPGGEGLTGVRDIEYRGGTSILKNQAACPFRAFAIHRLGAQEMDERAVGLSPRERGTIIHLALQHIWIELKSQSELKARPAAEIAAVIRKNVDLALDQGLSRRQKNSSLQQFRALEQSRLERLVKQWLDKELERPTFEVIEIESAMNIEINGLKLRVKIDRVDCQEGDGGHVLIDYKTSKSISIKEWDGERPDAPQLPLYAIKSRYALTEAAFAQILPGKIGFQGVRGEELSHRLPEWEAALGKLASDFLAGHAEVDPKYGRKTCELCRLQALCRVNSASVQRDDE